MFAVIFEVQPRPQLRDTYFARGRLLRPELEHEKALVRWRAHARHHETQSFGRSQVFLDYHLRVGEVVRDTRFPTGQVLRQQRLDETTAGAGTTITLVSAFRPEIPSCSSDPEATARWLGLEPKAPGLLSWDVCDAMGPTGLVRVDARPSADPGVYFPRTADGRSAFRVPRKLTRSAISASLSSIGARSACFGRAAPAWRCVSSEWPTAAWGAAM